MIITYDNNQDAPIDITNVSLAALTGYETEELQILNVTNKSFTVKLTVRTNPGVTIENLIFLVSSTQLGLLPPIYPSYLINGTDYIYTYRVSYLTPSVLYTIIPKIKISGVSDFYIEQHKEILTELPLVLSTYTDMSYADIRGLDLSASGLNMETNDNGSVVNFHQCLVNAQTIFEKEGEVSKNYDDYDLTKYNFVFDNQAISIEYKDITNNSITIYCDILSLIDDEQPFELILYISNDQSKLDLVKTIDIADYSLADSNGIKIINQINAIGLYKFRIYSLSPYTSYYIKSSINTTHTPIQNVYTLHNNFQVTNTMIDLSYSNLSAPGYSLSNLSPNVNLTNALISQSTIFPNGKTYLDYPEVLLKEFDISANIETNIPTFQTLLEPEKEKAIRFFINNYLKKVNVNSSNIPSSILGFTDKPQNIKIIRDDIKSVNILNVGNLKETMLYKPMIENDTFQIEDNNVTLLINGPSGPNNEYKLQTKTGDILSIEKYFNKGATINCFENFNILNGYAINLNSVGLSEFINAVLSGPSTAYYGRTISYNITLDVPNKHTLTFSLTNGQNIIIQSGSMSGFSNSLYIDQINTMSVSISNVSGDHSNFISFSGTVISIIKEIIEEIHNNENSFINNVCISSNVEDIPFTWNKESSLIEYLEKYPYQFNNKIPFYGKYCLTDISLSSTDNTVFKYETNPLDLKSSVYTNKNSSDENKTVLKIDLRNTVNIESVSVSYTSVVNNETSINAGPLIIETTMLFSLNTIPDIDYTYVITVVETDSTIKTYNGTFKTNIQQNTLENENTITTNQLKEFKSDISIQYTYTLTQETKITNCIFTFTSSSPVSSASDRLVCSASFEVARFYTGNINYPLKNKIIEFNVLYANGIYRNIKRVMMYFIDKIIDTKTYHFFEFVY